MSTITLEINIKQIQKAINRLKPQEKIRLIEHLERDTWPDRFKALLQRIDHKARKCPINENEINQTCEEIRHAHRSH